MSREERKYLGTVPKSVVDLLKYEAKKYQTQNPFLIAAIVKDYQGALIKNGYLKERRLDFEYVDWVTSPSVHNMYDMYAHYKKEPVIHKVLLTSIHRTVLVNDILTKMENTYQDGSWNGCVFDLEYNGTVIYKNIEIVQVDNKQVDLYLVLEE